MFTLTVFPDGRLILATEDYLSEEAARQVMDVFRRWRDTEPAEALILPATRIQHATSFEVNLMPEVTE